MTKNKAYLTIIGGTQQLRAELWKSYSEEAIQKAIDGAPAKLLEEMVEHLSSVAETSDAYIIVHDKDTKNIWNPELKKYEKVLKSLHVHFLFKFSEGATLAEIANALNLEIQY